MTYRSPAGLAAVTIASGLLAAAPAAAEPVTVDLRIEGATRTIFEGSVTTGVRAFRFTGEKARHRCDGTAALGGDNADPAPTRGAALVAAAKLAPFALEGSWNDDFGATLTEIDGESVAFDAGSGRFLAEYENGRFAQLGACADDIEDGDDVLFAFATGSEPVLALDGPGTARPGETVTVRVTDAGTGAPVAGASVGGAVTGADGAAVLGPFTGSAELQARLDGAIRSNGLSVCVTGDGDATACDTTAPRGRIAGLREQERLRRGPRTLRGTVAPDPSGLRAVRLRLTRQRGERCWMYSGERFLRRRCGKRRAFGIGDDAEWRHRLPERLRRGRYVLDAIAVDGAGNRDRLERGRSRVVFHVR